MSNSTRQFYEFGPFRLDVANRLLLREGQPLALTPKAVETLLALVRSGGEVLGKDDLMQQVWPGQFVEEGNLTQHIYLLRKTLKQAADGRNYIETLPRRGYRFVGEIREESRAADAGGAGRAPAQPAGEMLKTEMGRSAGKSFVGNRSDAALVESLNSTAEVPPASLNRRRWSGVHVLAATLIAVVALALLYPQLSVKRRPPEIVPASAENAEAERAYAKGRYYWARETTPALEEAVQYFEKALSREPAYALAYAGLADAYMLLSERYDMNQHQSDALPKAKAAATQAVQLNDQLAEGHAALATVKERYEWDWTGAETEFKRAIELNPNYAYAHQQYAAHLAATARLNEAKSEILRARELEPQSVSVGRDVGEILYFTGDYGQAIEQFRRTLEIDTSGPQAAALRRALGWIYEEQGMHDQAAAEFLEALRLVNGSPERLAALRRAYDSAGMKGYWRKWLEFRQGRIKLGGISPFHLAQVYTLLDEKDRAFDYLEKAFDDRCVAVAELRFGPAFGGLRSDGRYAALLRRMGL
ncbi:MAG TPA: winged helix-turn-helix domain-containing protein [Pyrinomonadaceae bacterium]|nr:winged helix-turn-helix domain-containing protein [Pyrinomonadaceae bacterium]